MTPPAIFPKERKEVYQEIRGKAPFYTPEWNPDVPGDFGSALARIFCHLSEVVATRGNRVLERHLLSFLEVIGASLLPAQPARVPLTFSLSTGALQEVPIPAGIQAAGQGADGKPVIFETEETIMATPARLESVCSAIYDHDQVFRHKEELDKGTQVQMFAGTNDQEHALYIAGGDIFNIGPGGQIDLDIGAVNGNLKDNTICTWQYVADVPEKWTNFTVSTGGVGGHVTLTIPSSAPIVERELFGKKKDRWIRCVINADEIKNVANIHIDSVRIKSGIQQSTTLDADCAYSNDIPLNPKEFYPFGLKPQLYSTFYLASEEAFSKKGYIVTLTFDLTPGRGSCIASDLDCSNKSYNLPKLSWEYWNGKNWVSLDIIVVHCTGQDGIQCSIRKDLTDSLPCIPATTYRDPPLENQVAATIYDCPEIPKTTINGIESCWIRVRLIDGDYGKEHYLIGNQLYPGRFCPPKINNLKIKYERIDDGFPPNYIIHKNNLIETDVTNETRGFYPFQPLPDLGPSLYLGFDKPLIGTPISLFFNLALTSGFTAKTPRITWEYQTEPSLSGTWKDLAVVDETKGFTRAGMVKIAAPDVMVPCKLFGSKTDLYWIRAVNTDSSFDIPTTKTNPVQDTAPETTGTQGSTGSASTTTLIPPPTLHGINPNSVWAVHSTTIQDENVGSSTGEANQVFRLLHIPVVHEEIWVNELASIGEADKADLRAMASLMERFDDEGKVIECWVRWISVQDFLYSKERERHYRIDHTSGEISFGDGQHGMVPPIGRNNIRGTYRTGGGSRGNLAASSITKLQSSVAFVDKVTNSIPSDGGCEAESVESLIERSPRTLRNGGKAVTLEDFEEITKESSRKIARFLVLPNTTSNPSSEAGILHLSGGVTIVIVPDTLDPAPLPSIELIQLVETYVMERAPNVITLSVIPPRYFQVNVTATLCSKKIDVIPAIEQEAKRALERFFHPLTGGRDKKGWGFGKVPCEADVYTLLEGIEGVEYVSDVGMTLSWVENPLEPVTMSDESRILALPHALACSGNHSVEGCWLEKEKGCH